jgi:hypothetical protein
MTGTDVAVAPHPDTGEVLDRLDEQPPELLARALDVVLTRKAQVEQWQTALETELRRRLKLRQTKHTVFGDWEVSMEPRRSREWDAADLEGVLSHLFDEGVIRAAEITDVIVSEPKVKGKEALALRSRLTGDALAAVDATWRWTEKPGKLTVARSVELAPEPETVQLVPSTTWQSAAQEEVSVVADEISTSEAEGAPSPYLPDGVPPAHLDHQELFA